MSSTKFAILISFGILIAFIAGVILFDFVEEDGETNGSTAQTSSSDDIGLKQIYVQGTLVAIDPGRDRLILESEATPEYAGRTIGGAELATPSVIPDPFEIAQGGTNPDPGINIIEITRIIDVTRIITRIVDVTRVVDVAADPIQVPAPVPDNNQDLLPQVAPTATLPPENPVLIATPTPNASESTAIFNHVVREGETLAGIAAAYGASFDEVGRLNQYKDYIYPGDIVRVPRDNSVLDSDVDAVAAPTPDDCSDGRIYTVGATDTAYKISILEDIALETLRARNGLGFDYLIYEGQNLCLAK